MLSYGCKLVCLAVLFLPACAAVQQEVCWKETFNATCAEDEVIMIKSAKYGRMQVGRCITLDIEYYLGCSVNVLKHVDSLCSGKRTWDFVVPTEFMKEMEPCPYQLKYLNVSYICVEGKQDSVSAITGSTFLLVAVLGVICYIIV